jgi:hypothetical protein
MSWLWLLLLVACPVLLVMHDTRDDNRRPELDSPPRGNRAKAVLVEYGIRPTHFTTARISIAYLLIACLSVGLLALWLDPTAGLKDKLSISGAVAAFVVAYTQWQLARYEASLEKYYDRLDIANRRLNTLVEQSWNNKDGNKGFDVYQNPPNVGVSLFDMWVFAELDNLEYVIEKYRRGYVEAEATCRGVHAFKGRCSMDPEFMRRSVEFCRSPVYHEGLRHVVRQISDEISRRD